MSDELLGMVMMGALLIGIFVGFPIAFTLLILALGFGYVGLGLRVFDLMYIQTVSLMREEVLAAVPLFIFMGYMVEQAGLMERLFTAFRFILAPLRGSLYLGVILTATMFAMATGIVGASVTVMGIMAAPVMIKSGYDVRLSAGAITAGGTLGILIPPSVMLVVMGPVMGVSVGKLYAAAFGPGFVLAALYIAYSLIRSYLQPHLGPPLAAEERSTSPWETLREFCFGMLPLAALILATLGSILAGLATPTEAAAIGALGAVALTCFYGKMDRARLREATSRTLATSSMILFLVVASNIFGSVFVHLGSATLVTEKLLALPLPPWGMLLLLMAIIFLLGWPLEWPAIILIFLPIFLPVVQALKFDLLWFGMLTAVNLQTAFLSPPVAMSAYYLKAVVPQWELVEIYKGMMQFMVLQLVGLAMVMLFPQIVLWLPGVVFK